MENAKEHILLVESDSQISDLVARQTLLPMGYLVDAVDSASLALMEIEKHAPDLIITDLDLPEINGKDLLVALAAQGVNLPIIIITPPGHENDALQAFRLGAMNFLAHPLREAEIINVVEDTLRQFRKRNELKQYSLHLDEITQKLEQHINDLIEIFSIAKLIPSARNQQAIFEKIITTAARVTRADDAWIAVFDVQRDKYILRAYLNADEAMRNLINQPWEDGISSLLAISGKTLSLHAEALKEFTSLTRMEALLATPIRWKDEIVGLLSVTRKTPEPFSNDQQSMLEMIAEFTSSLIENSRRYQLLEQRAYALQQTSVYTMIDADLKNDLLQQASLELRGPLKSLVQNLDTLTNLTDRRMSLKQSDALNMIHEEADQLMEISDAMARIDPGDTSRVLEEIDLNQVIKAVVNRYLAIAQACRLSIKVELPSEATLVTVFPSQITRVIEGLVSNALKYSPAKSEITIRLERKQGAAIFSIHDHGEEIDDNIAEKLFDAQPSLYGKEARRFGGVGISLPLIKEIVTAHHGKVWVESAIGKGFRILFSLSQ